MNTKRIAIVMLFSLFIAFLHGQNAEKSLPSSAEELPRDYKYSVMTTWHTFMNFGEEKTNTHHYELHFRYKLTAKDRLGIKTATWKMFAPMGMPIQKQFEFDESTFYNGRLNEIGVGLTYQRMLWKGLFAAVEVMPQLTRYIDENGDNIANGFKFYTSYHVGYHIPLFKNRMYIEPQIHCNYWPVNTNVAPDFKAKENKWNNFILFEPNIYIGINF